MTKLSLGTFDKDHWGHIKIIIREKLLWWLGEIAAQCLILMIADI